MIITASKLFSFRFLLEGTMNTAAIPVLPENVDPDKLSARESLL
jgi:hypothetical protein